MRWRSPCSSLTLRPIQIRDACGQLARGKGLAGKEIEIYGSPVPSAQRKQGPAVEHEMFRRGVKFRSQQELRLRKNSQSEPKNHGSPKPAGTGKIKIINRLTCRNQTIRVRLSALMSQESMIAVEHSDPLLHRASP